MKQKRVFILGSTGSIGLNTLKVVARYPSRFKVVGLTAYSNSRLLLRQVKQFKPSYVGTSGENLGEVRESLNDKRVSVFDVAHDDLNGYVSGKDVDVVVIGMRGAAALHPFLSAVRSGKTVAPANKEALVVAGEILMKEARKNGAKIIPVDSEQSAIFQCLEGHSRAELKKVYLTASGGALAHVPKSKFDSLSIKEILNHPRWRMGKKITVDSAMLMNKGFEIIEAKRLFQLEMNEIEVIVHPEAVIHSMVSFKDGSIIAQLGITDMRLPIQYALTYPQRWDTGLTDLDFYKVRKLHFDKPDYKKFPSLKLAIEVANEGGTLPSVLNAADEVAVDAFLSGRIKFTKIYEIVKRTVWKHKVKKDPSLKEILQADAWARGETSQIIDKVKKRHTVAYK